jgi:protein-tyrosine phosphatase
MILLHSNLSPPSKTHHIIWNVLLGDKQLELTQQNLDDDNICHIVAILPHESDFLKLNTQIKDFPYTVLEYGDGHNTTIDKSAYDKCGSFIDSVAKKEGRGNILVFCNNGYQRSVPFLVYYLTTFHKDEVPDIEKALDIILSQVDRNNYMEILKPMVDSVSKLLV